MAPTKEELTTIKSWFLLQHQRVKDFNKENQLWYAKKTKANIRYVESLFFHKTITEVIPYPSRLRFITICDNRESLTYDQEIFFMEQDKNRIFTFIDSPISEILV